MSHFPLTYRRARQNPWVRSLVRQVELKPNHFMQPLFCIEGISTKEPVPGITGTFRDTTDSILKQIENDVEAGVRSFLLFGVPQSKAKSNFSHKFTTSTIAAIKKQFGKDIFLGVDVCLCSSTTHGHCGILNEGGDHVLNNESVNELARAATEYAAAGADCVAPSDMMDGRILAIRESLSKAGLDQTILMSYSAKFNSKFYGPFRVAADSAPKGEMKLKDRATYQIDPANPMDAFNCSVRDAEEGADILMVKPGLPYLDQIAKLSQEIPLPWAVYEVSGEYAAIEKLAEAGLIDAKAAHLECWTALARAGASIIISYGSRFARDWIKESI